MTCEAAARDDPLAETTHDDPLAETTHDDPLAERDTTTLWRMLPRRAVAGYDSGRHFSQRAVASRQSKGRREPPVKGSSRAASQRVVAYHPFSQRVVGPPLQPKGRRVPPLQPKGRCVCRQSAGLSSVAATAQRVRWSSLYIQVGTCFVLMAHLFLLGGCVGKTYLHKLYRERSRFIYTEL